MLQATDVHNAKIVIQLNEENEGGSPSPKGEGEHINSYNDAAQNMQDQSNATNFTKVAAAAHENGHDFNRNKNSTTPNTLTPKMS